MARSGGGISGTGVALVAGGALLLYAGIRNRGLLDALRDVASGNPVTDVPATPTAVQLGATDTAPASSSGGDTVAPSGSLNASIASTVRKYLGIPYKINGATPSGFDCSGLVTWVLHHDLGLNLPSNSHTVTGQWYTWSGATTIDRSQCTAGDLVCYPTHIGIAVSPTRMIAAPSLGRNVQEQNIYWTPTPRIRRVKPQTSGGTNV